MVKVREAVGTPVHSPEWFLTEIVQPTVEEFLRSSDPNRVRRAMLAALVVSSLADHIGVAQRAKSLREFRDKLAEECTAFALVRDVGDAAKHVRLDRGDVKLMHGPGIQPRVWIQLGSEVTLAVAAVVPQDGSQVATLHLDELLQDALAFLRTKMAQQPSDITGDEMPNERRRIAEDAATSPQTLAALAQDPDASVRRVVAKNIATWPQTLAALAQDPDPAIRVIVAGNRLAPSEMLILLAQDPDAAVRWRVAKNTATPSEALAALARDPDDDVRRAAEERLLSLRSAVGNEAQRGAMD